MSLKNEEPVDVYMSEMLEESGEPFVKSKKSWFAAFVGFFMISILTGVGLGLVSSPVLGVVKNVETAGAEFWDSFDKDLDLDIQLAGHTVLLDRDGKAFARFYSEDRREVSLDEVSENVVQALLATEDSRYYERDSAVDVKGLGRAFVKNLTSDSKQGGSTITQQLVENIRLYSIGDKDDRSAVDAARGQGYSDKIQEIKYAVELEKKYTKDEILEKYLNIVYFGNGAYGVQAAAKRYFSVDAKDLDLAQSAVLAGLMKSPVLYDPTINPKNAKDRRDTVLYRMEEVGYITEAERDAAVAKDIELDPAKVNNGCGKSKYPFYCELVKNEMLTNPVFGEDRETREQNFYRGGLRVKTALIPAKQKVAEDAVKEAFDKKSDFVAAQAIVEPGTGLVTAVAQSRSYGNGKNQTEIVYANRNAFQPGSTFKLVPLVTALEQGLSVKEKIVSNNKYVPSNMDYPQNGFSNNGGYSYGPINASEAWKKSVNVYFVKLIERTGVDAAVDVAERLGYRSIPSSGEKGAPNSRSASFALGAWEVSPIDNANAYATIAANGISCRPTVIISVKDVETGKNLEAPSADCYQAIDPNVAKEAGKILTSVFEEGGPGANYTIGRQAAGKTGTTNSYAAVWFAGFTPQYSTAVWVGDPRGGSKYPLVNVTAFGRYYPVVYGADIPTPIWSKTMKGIHEGLPKSKIGNFNSDQTSLELRSIPSVVGMNVDAAVSTLLNAGYKISINEETSKENDKIPTNVVVEQSPDSGTTLKSGILVKLTLSHGSVTDFSFPEEPKR